MLDRLDKLAKHIITIYVLLFVLLFVFWSIGYFMNAFTIWGAKFDLDSCWKGAAALGGGGVLAAIKYIYDSVYNTVKGESL